MMACMFFLSFTPSTHTLATTKEASSSFTVYCHFLSLLCLHTNMVCSIRGNGEVIRREEFEQRKAAAEAAHQARLNRKPQKLASHGKDLEGCPLLQVTVRSCCVASCVPQMQLQYQQHSSTTAAWCILYISSNTLYGTSSAFTCHTCCWCHVHDGLMQAHCCAAQAARPA